MTRTSFHRGQSRNSATQKARSSGVSFGLRSRLGVGCELLPQGQFDDCLLIAASEEGERRATEYSHEIEQSLNRERDAAPFPPSDTG